MKQTNLALSAVMIVAVGLVGTNFVTGLETTEQGKFGVLSSSNDIYGHITIVHSDPDGNILAYIQTDNAVAAIGKDCLSELIFGDHGTTCSAGNFNTNFTTIALYAGESFSSNANTTGDPNVLDNTLTDLGLTVRNGGQGVVVSNTQAGGGSGTGSITSIEKTFTAGTNVANVLVNAATLLNNGTGGPASGPPTAVLAGQTFADVTLNESDTLKITWLIELG